MDPIDCKTFLTSLLKGLVSFPDEIKITQTLDELGVLLSVNVHAEDMGKIIGKSGETAKAIRRVMNSFGFLRRQKVNVKILEANQ